MNTYEYKFAKNIVDLDKKITEAMFYIKDNFGIISEYDEDNGQLNLLVENINENEQLSEVKKYIENTFDLDYISTNI